MYYTTEFTDNGFRESFIVHNELTRQKKIRDSWYEINRNKNTEEKRQLRAAAK